MEGMVIIADDLSGAADCGIACATHGLSSIVVLDENGADVEADVIAVDADTRHRTAEAATTETARMVERFAAEGRVLYRKMDSTLRGHVAAELAAVLACRRRQAPSGVRVVAVLAPAFPASGRTTVAGRQLLHGQPLERTDLWKREVSPPRSHLAGMLHEVGLETALLSLAEIRSGRTTLEHKMRMLAEAADVLVCDSETDSDLRTIAEASMGLGQWTVWAGSAGLAYHLPSAAGLARWRPLKSTGSLTKGPSLFVVGSLSRVSRAQAELLAARTDTVIVSVLPAILLAGSHSPEWEAKTQQLRRCLDAGTDAVVLPAAETQLDAAVGQQLCASLAEFVTPFLDRIGALVATGGESARGVLQAWGVNRLRLIREIETGVPFSVAESGARSMPVLTKAGAFGTPETLLHCHRFLRELDREPADALY